MAGALFRGAGMQRTIARPTRRPPPEPARRRLLFDQEWPD